MKSSSRATMIKDKISYMKEINSLRELLKKVHQNKNSPNKNEYLEIRFFDPTDGLEPEYIYILNGKLNDLKELYNNKLNEFNEKNEELLIKIELLKMLSPSVDGDNSSTSQDVEPIVLKPDPEIAK